MDQNESDIPSTEAEVDSLLQSIDQPSAEPTDAPDMQAAPPQQSAWTPPSGEIPFKIGDKELKVKWDQLSKWAEMGYGAPARIGELNKQIDSWKSREAQINEWHKSYGEIDGYVKQNPQFWQHVMDTYQKRDALMNDPNNPLAQTVNQLQSKLGELEQFKMTLEEREQQQRIQQEDNEYLNEFTKLKEAYPDIDFETPDAATGKSLEYQVLEYATQHKIPKFKTAFLDFYHDQLKARYESGAKEKLVKNKVENTKRGIIGKTPTPTKGVSDNIRGKSYNQLAEETVREIEQGLW